MPVILTWAMSYLSYYFKKRIGSQNLFKLQLHVLILKLVSDSVARGAKE